MPPETRINKDCCQRKQPREIFSFPARPKTYLFHQKILKLVGRTSKRDPAIENGLIWNASFSPWDGTFFSDPETSWRVDGTRKRDSITASDMVCKAPLSSQAKMLEQSGTGRGIPPEASLTERHPEALRYHQQGLV